MTIEGSISAMIDEVAKAGGCSVRSVEFAFNRMGGDCLPIEVHVRMHRTRRNRAEVQRASGFGITVWDAASMAFAEAERMKSIGWELER